MKKYYIYRMSCGGKYYYIGITNNYTGRYNSHFNKIKSSLQQISWGNKIENLNLLDCQAHLVNFIIENNLQKTWVLKMDLLYTTDDFIKAKEEESKLISKKSKYLLNVQKKSHYSDKPSTTKWSRSIN